MLAYGGLAVTESRHVPWWWGPVHVYRDRRLGLPEVHQLSYTCHPPDPECSQR